MEDRNTLFRSYLRQLPRDSLPITFAPRRAALIYDVSEELMEAPCSQSFIAHMKVSPNPIRNKNPI